MWGEDRKHNGGVHTVGAQPSQYDLKMWLTVLRKEKEVEFRQLDSTCQWWPGWMRTWLIDCLFWTHKQKFYGKKSYNYNCITIYLLHIQDKVTTFWTRVKCWPLALEHHLEVRICHQMRLIFKRFRTFQNTHHTSCSMFWKSFLVMSQGAHLPPYEMSWPHWLIPFIKKTKWGRFKKLLQFNEKELY